MPARALPGGRGSCMGWVTAGEPLPDWRDPWSELLRLQNVIKGSGDVGERNEGLLVVHTRSHSLTSVCLASVLHLHNKH